MPVTISQHQYFAYTPPVSAASAVEAVSGTAGSLDLRAVGNQTVNYESATQQTTGLQGHLVDFQNDGAQTVYVCFGPSSASVTAANAPNPATTGVNTAGACRAIPAGATIRFALRPGVDNFVGFVTSTSTSTLRIFHRLTEETP
ncbi:MAG TPA: hypothetical protein VGI39_32900 [Polyangiaceae bacterium]|jgi:hypothetical protein